MPLSPRRRLFLFLGVGARDQVIVAEGRLEVSLRAPKPLPPIEDTSNLKPLADLKRGEELAGAGVPVVGLIGWARGRVGQACRV